MAHVRYLFIYSFSVIKVEANPNRIESDPNQCICTHVNYNQIKIEVNQFYSCTLETNKNKIKFVLHMYITKWINKEWHQLLTKMLSWVSGISWQGCKPKASLHATCLLVALPTVSAPWACFWLATNSTSYPCGTYVWLQPLTLQALACKVNKNIRELK